jgi:hypothetical protein
MIFERYELILEQEKILEQKTMDRVCKILDENDINTSRHSLNSWAVRGNAVDPGRECKQYSDQLRGQRNIIKWWYNEIHRRYV